ncbi:MAG: glycosyltransferase family 4 protein, partial [Promethearchaeota archaeon]
AGRFELSLSGGSRRPNRIIASVIELAKRIVFSLSDSIVAESASVINWLGLARYRQKTRLGQTFVDTTHFHPRSKFDQRETLVGYIGVFHESKGVINFIKSIPRVLKEHPAARFLVGGAGPALSSIHEAIEGLSLGSTIEQITWIPNNEVPVYLSKLKLLVLPSKSEGLPNIILEAMACGTPVLATPVGAIPDLIKEGKTGFLLKDSTTSSISQGIIRALNSPDLEKISLNSRRLVEQSFSYEAAVKRYKAILKPLS